MVAIPFIYFGLLLIFNTKRNGFFNIGTYILILYTFISFMSIILVSGNYYDWSVRDYPMQPYAPVLYITLLSICIFPFLRKMPKIDPRLSPKAEKLLDYMTYGYFIIFCIILAVSLTRIQEVLTSNALAEIRNEQYTGDAEAFYNHLQGIPRYICAICQILAPSANIMTLITMYNLAFRKKGFFYNVMGLLGSMSMLLVAINIADRSNFVYWVLFLGLSIFIFYPYLSKKKKLTVTIVVSIVLIAIFSYFMAVTSDRFEDRTEGTEGGLISYAGQSFINFCNFIEYVRPANSLCELFPLTTFLLGGAGYFEVAETVQSDVSLFIPVFSTFLGYIYSISGGLVLAVFILFYNRVTNYFITAARKKLTLGPIVRIWALSLVVVLGLFGYYYSFANCTIALIVWFIISYILTPPESKKKRISTDLDNNNNANK
jgi:oligosaccharide repeat unit polymerase